MDLQHHGMRQEGGDVAQPPDLRHFPIRKRSCSGEKRLWERIPGRERTQGNPGISVSTQAGGCLQLGGRTPARYAPKAAGS